MVSEEGRLKGSSGVVSQFDECPLIAISGHSALMTSRVPGT